MGVEYAVEQHEFNPHDVNTLMREFKSLCESAPAGAAPRVSASQALQRHIEGFERKLNLVLAEHEGMANELLQAFEQLGVVFELTRRLASVKEEGEALRLFVESLRPMFPHCQVLTVRPDLQSEPPGFGCELSRTVLPRRSYDSDTLPSHPDGGDQPRRSLLDEVVTECRTEQRVVVKDFPECAEIPQAMAGPIHAGEEFAGTVVVLRQSQARRFNSADMLLLDSLGAFCGDIIRNLRLVHELRQLSIDMIRGMVSAIDQKDGYTSGHSNRVAVYARLLAEALGWSDERLQMLEWSALLHDVGKIGIRDAVLKKCGKLTPDEFEHMKEHPVRSYEVVKGIPQLADAIDGVLHHHERYDGKGYPSGLSGENIPLQARVIQIADVFDALTSSRSYRKAFSWEKALGILKEESGVVVDPTLAGVFEKLIRSWASRDPQGFESMFATSAAQAPPEEARGETP